ncbi:MAG: type II secretion system protein [Desulfosoma sp.]|uniref:type II secretion system protein n=1 Tax=Desulfosoma sp. TaxID=2603217 RepID=UPI00404B2CF6
MRKSRRGIRKDEKGTERTDVFGAKAQGFSLLEVLVALTIMGITVAVLFYGFSQSAQLRWRAQGVWESARVAQMILADTALMDEAARRGVMKGPVDGEPGWFFRLEARPLVIPLDRQAEAYEDPRMVELTLCVFFEAQAPGAPRCLVSWYERRG